MLASYVAMHNINVLSYIYLHAYTILIKLPMNELHTLF